MRHFRGFPLITVLALPGLLASLLAWAGDAANTQTVRGKVIEVSPDAKQITVQPRKGEAVKLTVDDRSQVQLRQGDGKPDRLREGMRVRATYETKDGTNRVVALRDPLGTLQKAGKAADAALSALKDTTYQKREEYRQKAQEMAHDLDDRIEELEERAEDVVGPEARARYQHELEELRRNRQILRDRMSEAGRATEQGWGDVRSSIGTAIDEVQRGIDRARSRFDAPPDAR